MQLINQTQKKNEYNYVINLFDSREKFTRILRYDYGEHLTSYMNMINIYMKN